MATKRKTSTVWAHFTEEPGTPSAKCHHCHSTIRRGKEGDRKSWSSKPLWSHLQSKHRSAFKEASQERAKDETAAKKRKLEEKERAEIYVGGTPKLANFLEKKQKYAPDNPEQKSINDLLTTWLADAVLPHQVIDNQRYFFYIFLI